VAHSLPRNGRGGDTRAMFFLQLFLLLRGRRKGCFSGLGCRGVVEGGNRTNSKTIITSCELQQKARTGFALRTSNAREN